MFSASPGFVGQATFLTPALVKLRVGRFGDLEFAFGRAAGRVDFRAQRGRPRSPSARAFSPWIFGATIVTFSLGSISGVARSSVWMFSLDREGAFVQELVFDGGLLLLALGHRLRDARFEFPFGAERVCLRHLRGQPDFVGDRERDQFEAADFSRRVCSRCPGGSFPVCRRDRVRAPSRVRFRLRRARTCRRVLCSPRRAPGRGCPDRSRSRRILSTRYPSCRHRSTRSLRIVGVSTSTAPSWKPPSAAFLTWKWT